MTNDKDYIDKLALIEIRDKKLLVTLSKGKDAWYMPGGKRELGETDHAALCREIKEELGVILNPAQLTYYGTFEAQAHGKPAGTRARLTCYTGPYGGEPQALSEIAEIAYFSYDQRHRVGPSGQLIMDDLKAKGLIE